VKRVLSLLVLLISAVLLTAILRLGLCEVLTLSNNGHSPTFLCGDRILVNRWSYGFRLPFSPTRIYGTKMPNRGDWIAFNAPVIHKGDSPDSGNLSVGRILALPGDTVWIGAQGNVCASCNYSLGCVWPFTVPASGTNAYIHPWSGVMYADVINRHEMDSAFFVGDSMLVNGIGVNRYVFRRDYFWVSSGMDDNYSDSRTLGLVPRESLIGRLECVLYSVDADQPWFQKFRRDRVFCPVR